MQLTCKPMWSSILSAVGCVAAYEIMLWMIYQRPKIILDFVRCFKTKNFINKLTITTWPGHQVHFHGHATKLFPSHWWFYYPQVFVEDSGTNTNKDQNYTCFHQGFYFYSSLSVSISSTCHYFISFLFLLFISFNNC